MILSDREIRAAMDYGQIRIHPPLDEKLWTSTAIDVTLDGVLLRWKKEVSSPPSGEPHRIRPYGPNFNVRAMMEDPHFAEKVQIDKQNGFTLEPGMFVLGYTKQSVYLPNRSRLAARVEGKSSLARIGVGVHVTAPVVHAGFGYRDNAKEEDQGSPIQLEIFNLGSLFVILDEEMPICQLVLEEVREVPKKGYTGRFNEQTGFIASL